MSEYREPEVVEIESLLGRKFEPKRRCRWLISIEGIDPFLAKKVTRPALANRDGDHIFDPMSIELYDAIMPSAAQMAWLWLHDNDERDVTLKMLDPVGTVVEEWLISKAKPSFVDFGELDYASAEPATVKLQLSFSRCELKY